MNRGRITASLAVIGSTAQPFEFFRRFRSELIQEANSGTYPNIIETLVYYKSDREFEVIFTVVSPITQAINQANAIVAQTANRVNMVIVYEGDPRPDEAEGAFFEDAGLSPLWHSYLGHNGERQPIRRFC